jgi:hypothetical protein
MKKIEKEFCQKDFYHKQIHREQDYAIYERWWKDSPEKKHYEVIKIQSHNGYAIAGQKYPPSEFYPGSNSWGLHGFTSVSKEDAYKRLDKLMAEDKIREEERKKKEEKKKK